MRRVLGRAILALAGWRAVGVPPEEGKYVLVCAPHTSNWDFVFLKAYELAHDLRFVWLGKHTLFRPPFRRLMRALGGLPVDRSSPGGVVDQVIAAFRAADRLIVAIPPEGTRSRTEVWKSGFYRVACGAGVKVALGFEDYAKREVGIGPSFELTGDPRVDMEKIRAFYADKTPRHPELFGPVRLAAETLGASP